MSEDLLNRLRAERMTLRQLREEILRIGHAKLVAARERERARYDRRHAVYAAELARRSAQTSDAR